MGFVRHLPHQLVEAFRSTLEEVAGADLVLHVVDGSHPDPEGQLAAVREVLAEVGGRTVPELVVVNKADAADPEVVAACCAREAVVVGLRPHRRGLDGLASRSPSAAAAGRRGRRAVPFSRGDLVSRVHAEGEVAEQDHTGEGTRLRARVRPGLAAELSEFVVDARRAESGRRAPDPRRAWQPAK